MIKIQNLSVVFDSQKILDNISFSINDNDLILIIGKSGQGKTVLIKTILGLNPFYSGKIFYENNLLGKIKNHNSSLVFQSSALLDFMTNFENVALPLFENSNMKKHQIIKKVNEIFHKLDIDDISSKYPSQISGGMKKRVAIARAVITNPKYIFYDEPTTGLDPNNASKVLNLIKEIHTEGKTSVIVTHDKRILANLSARIIMIHQGKIIFDGNYNELISATDKRINNYLRSEEYEL
jgi:phospholipid/cholesterol/gamma-HCH transport system ATP-binding protein